MPTPRNEQHLSRKRLGDEWCHGKQERQAPEARRNQAKTRKAKGDDEFHLRSNCTPFLSKITFITGLKALYRALVKRSETEWSVEQSAELYGINNWGADYFSVSRKGEVMVHPHGNGVGVSLR